MCESVMNNMNKGAGLEDCKSGAPTAGANAFNFDQNNNMCYLKDCADGDLKLEYRSYGSQRTRFTDIYSC